MVKKGLRGVHSCSRERISSYGVLLTNGITQCYLPPNTGKCAPP